jgi:hypothetical protein
LSWKLINEKPHPAWYGQTDWQQAGGGEPAVAKSPMLINVGAVQATAAPAPMRLSADRREIPVAPLSKPAPSPAT